jgi:hypothetical protein
LPSKFYLVQLQVDVEAQSLDVQLTRIFTNMYTLGIEADTHPSLYGFRTQIIDRVLKEHLIPMAIQAVRDEMLKISQQRVVDTCCDALWTEATTPPLQLKAITDEVSSHHFLSGVVLQINERLTLSFED